MIRRNNKTVNKKENHVAVLYMQAVQRKIAKEKQR